MERGKQTCKILKDIRRQIAEANDIAFITSECRHKGDCAGTCPKCEAEVRYLEEQLERRRSLGKATRLAGLAAGIGTVVAACSPEDPEPMLQGAPVPPEMGDPVEIIQDFSAQEGPDTFNLF